MQKLHPLIANELDANGIEWHLEGRGKHDAVVLKVNGRERRVFIARSASDWRSQLNNRAEVRRRVRELGGTIKETARVNARGYRAPDPRPDSPSSVPVHAPEPVVAQETQATTALSSPWTPPPFSPWEPPEAPREVEARIHAPTFELEGWTI
jgi:hypothetical protein